MATTRCKPAGMPVFPPHRDPSGSCVLAAVLSADPWRGEVAWPTGFEGGIAHRLDVPTSGALWLADTPEELGRMRAWFADGRLRKTYLFEAAKDVPWDEHVVDHELAHDKRKKGRMVVRRGQNTPHRGRWYPAHTELTRVDGSLWQAVITTGVMHQIRAHAAFVGLPLRGDRRYGGGETPEGWSSEFRLHHVGLMGPEGGTDPVERPAWAGLGPG